MKQMLYKPGGNKLIWGIKCEVITVEADEVPEKLKGGWFKSPLDFDKKPARKTRKKADDNEG